VPNPTEADWAKIKGEHTWDTLAGNNKYHNLVKRRMEPLKEYLGLSHAELEKIFLRHPAVLTYGPRATTTATWCTRNWRHCKHFWV
jgi:hypothetical protein